MKPEDCKAFHKQVFVPNNTVVAVVGEDFTREHEDVLRKRGIDTLGIEHAPGKTFRWVGKFGRDLSDAKTLDTQLNVFADFKPRLSETQKRALL